MLYKPAGGLLAGFLCALMFLYPRHSSRRIKPPEPPEGNCTICLKCMDYFYAIFFVDKLRSICYNQSDLWITYEEGGEDRLVKGV